MAPVPEYVASMIYLNEFVSYHFKGFNTIQLFNILTGFPEKAVIHVKNIRETLTTLFLKSVTGHDKKPLTSLMT